MGKGEYRRTGTETSSFGTPGRINHDSTKFYESRLYKGLNKEKKVMYIENEIPKEKINRILIHIDGEKFMKEDYQNILDLSQIITESGEIGEFELGNLRVEIKDLTTFEHDLVKNQF